MESFFGHTEESAEDASGRKKSKIKSLKTRLFRKSKGASEEGNPKLSQSVSDIAVGKELGSDEDLACPQGMMGSRALSHDSIFLADQVLSDTEPTRILSQENVHSKIKALQMKLQLQKLHFGPPPMVLPVRRPEELESHSEDSLLHISDDTSTEGTCNKTTSQPASHALSPIPKSVPAKSLPPTPLQPLSFPAQPNSSASTVEAPLDFSTPAQFTASLDISAARHRMSVKPRNQRASTKKKPSSLSQSGSPLRTQNNISYPESVNEHVVTQEEETEKAEKEVVDIPQHLPLKSEEMLSVSSEKTPKLSSQSFSQKNHTLSDASTSLVMRARSHRHTATASSGRPHSSFIESEIKEKREAFFEKEEIPNNKRNSLKKTGMAEFPSEQFPRTSRASSTKEPPHGEDETTRGPRSGSFVGVPEDIEAKRKKFEGKEEKSISGKEELKSVQPRGNPSFLPPKSSVIPWERKDSLRKTECATAFKNIPTDGGDLKAEELDSSQELVEAAEEAREVQEEQGKTAFGIKLRATSQSLKLRSEAAANHHSKTGPCEDQSDNQKKQEISDSASRMSEKLPANISAAPRPTDAITCGIFPPAKHNTPPSNPMLTEVQKTSSNLKEAETTPQESEPSPQKSSSEVSWMSLAMEKTRSLQQLFSSRFPRDFTGTQTPPQPPSQVQPTSQTEATAGMLQAVKPSTVAMQQKMALVPPVQSSTSRESQMSKQTSADQSLPDTSQSPSASHPVVQTIPWTAPSPLRSSQTASTSQPLVQNYPSSGQQQSSWSNRGFQPATQLKSTTSTPATSATATTSDSVSRKGESEAIGLKDGPPPSIIRGDRTGSVVNRAAFLEKRAEWVASPLIKGVELRKVQPETQTSDDHLSSAKNTPTSRYSLADGRQGTKSAESSPTKMPEKLHETKWLRKNVGSSSPSSSPTQLQAMSDSGQPSWMEMAKRKSMAWSDKTMD